MPSRDFPIPETRVLLIASHVVYGYVGNKTASYVLQALGCDVSALNTVHFSNHTAYKQWTGTKQSGDEMLAIWDGLKKCDLVASPPFDMMLTGYCPGASAVQAAGYMARELRTAATMRPGSFFWILDPVMGDDGRLYVDPGVVPVYRSLLDHADLIVPNQFELETLAGPGAEGGEGGSESSNAIDSWAGMLHAIETLHREHRVPHILVTSVRLPPANSSTTSTTSNTTSSPSPPTKTLSVVGSTRTSVSTGSHPRAFRIDVPEFDCFFAGTGDLLASLVAVRLREAAISANLLDTASWLSPDDVQATDLPLAKAAEKALASMHSVLEKTMRARDEVLGGSGAGAGAGGTGKGKEGKEQEEGAGAGGVEAEKALHRKRTRAAELRIVRNVGDLLDPRGTERFAAVPLDSLTLPQNRG